MEDAVRPSEEAFKAIYERGYNTWSSLHKKTPSDAHLAFDSLNGMDAAFPSHPCLPKNLVLDGSFSNTILAKGTSTWSTTTHGSCDLPTFQEEVIFSVAAQRPTVVNITSDAKSTQACMFPQWFGENNNHISVLTLAWAYILSARWAEIIPGVCGPFYTEVGVGQNGSASPTPESKTTPASSILTIDVGDADDDALQWWNNLVSPEQGWDTSVQNAKGNALCSPWSTRLQSSRPPLRFSRQNRRHLNGSPGNTRPRPPSFRTAQRYVNDYCRFYNVVYQSRVALAAALLIPVTKFDNRSINLPVPRVQRILSPQKTEIISEETKRFSNKPTTAVIADPRQFDRLLTLSCNAVGTKSLLCSVFFEPDILCNSCGAWLQGTFAFLDSDAVKNDPHKLASIMMKRDPGIAFLWLGAFITGTHTRSLQEGRQGWWKTDLHAGAWTDTLVSFVQQPVTKRLSLQEEAEDKSVTRADECRLLFLSHDPTYAATPLFPFVPFGSTALDDTNIDVRRHTQCGAFHGLSYQSITWRCHEDQQEIQRPPGCSTANLSTNLRIKNGQSASQGNNVPVTYDDLDWVEDDCSEMVTRNIFTWLRDEDGFPIPERAIREHAWIDNLDSDDDSLITGDTQSDVRCNLHGWLIKTLTSRAHSL